MTLSRPIRLDPQVGRDHGRGSFRPAQFGRCRPCESCSGVVAFMYSTSSRRPLLPVPATALLHDVMTGLVSTIVRRYFSAFIASRGLGSLIQFLIDLRVIFWNAYFKRTDPRKRANKLARIVTALRGLTVSVGTSEPQ